MYYYIIKINLSVSVYLIKRVWNLRNPILYRNYCRTATFCVHMVSTNQHVFDNNLYVGKDIGLLKLSERSLKAIFGKIT